MQQEQYCLVRNPDLQHLTITKLLDFCEELELEYGREVFVTFLICDYPHVQIFRNCPESVRPVIPGRLEQWLQRSKVLVNRPENKQSIEATIKALKENRKDNWRQELVVFEKYTAMLDKQRNESMEEAFPELHTLMYRSNS